MSGPGNLSSFMAGGQSLSIPAGNGAINPKDLVSVGGLGGRAWTAATIDYAANDPAGVLLAPLAIGGAAALPGVTRNPAARDALGNIYVVGTNTSGNLVVYKYSPLGGSPIAGNLDATATSVNGARMVPLSNGTFAVIYARAAGALFYLIFDSQLQLVKSATSIATEDASTNVVYHDACYLAGGGFAVVYQLAAGTQVLLVTYNNAGTVVQAATNIQTLASTAAVVCLNLSQMQNGNLVCAIRGTMTVGGNAGTSFVIVNASGVNQAGPISFDTTSTLGLIEVTQLPNNTFAIAVANGTNIICGLYGSTGTLVGSKYTAADTLNNTTYLQIKLVNDGVNAYLVYVGSVVTGVVAVQIPATGAAAGVSVSGAGSGTISTSTWTVDAAVLNGLLTVFAADSATGGQCWMSLVLPDPTLGIGSMSVRTAPTTIGAAAGTTGARGARLLAGGGGLYLGASAPTNYPQNNAVNSDWTAIMIYDHQNTAGTFLAITKIENSSIVGVSQAQVAAGNPGSSVGINPGSGNYPINALAGSSDTAFNHSASSQLGNAGVLYAQGASFSNPATTTGGSGTSFVQCIPPSTSYTYTATSNVMLNAMPESGLNTNVNGPGIPSGTGVGLNAGNNYIYLAAGQSITFVTGTNKCLLSAQKVI